jgi:hypothetical protein
MSFRAPVVDSLDTERLGSLVSRGALLFVTNFTPEQGLGFLFNGHRREG